jgi:hypothetical protein
VKRGQGTYHKWERKKCPENFKLKETGQFGDLHMNGRLVTNWNTWTGCDFVDWIQLAYEEVWL